MALPAELNRHAALVRKFRDRYVPFFQREEVNEARLRLAVWACEVEGLPITPTNIRSILGSDAAEALGLVGGFFESRADLFSRLNRLRRDPLEVEIAAIRPSGRTKVAVVAPATPADASPAKV